MTSTTARPGTSWKSTLAAAGIAAAGGFVVNSVIALAGRGLLDAPAEFMPLQPQVYGMLTLVGALAGAVGWHLVATRSGDAGRLLRVLVPVVLVLSWIPDVVLLVTRSQPGTTTAGVLCLMLMHLGVAAAAVPAYRRLIPPRS
ncbi:DUF6069 family protein [Dactylosporangium sp. CA-139114]|uniref:DUF6069 family protein n=1 Tax=Dactylosporangium sp. CA-139114 TaxID=3239931 RepID=UPI003D9859B0